MKPHDEGILYALFLFYCANLCGSAFSKDCEHPLTSGWLFAFVQKNFFYLGHWGTRGSCLVHIVLCSFVFLSSHKVHACALHDSMPPDRTWCASRHTGRHTGTFEPGLIAEVNCSRCGAGKYQTGSGFFESLLSQPSFMDHCFRQTVHSDSLKSQLSALKIHKLGAWSPTVIAWLFLLSLIGAHEDKLGDFIILCCASLCGSA